MLDWRIPGALGASRGVGMHFFEVSDPGCVGDFVDLSEIERLVWSESSVVGTRTTGNPRRQHETTCWTGGFPVPWVLLAGAEVHFSKFQTQVAWKIL